MEKEQPPTTPLASSVEDLTTENEFSFSGDEGTFAKIERRMKDGDPWESVGRLSPPADEETIREAWGGGIYRVSVFGKQANGRGCRRAQFQVRLAGTPRAGSAPASPAVVSLDSELARLGQLAAVFKSMMPPPAPPLSDSIMSLLLSHAFKRGADVSSSDPVAAIRQIKEAAKELGLAEGGEKDPTWPEILDKNAPRLLEVAGGFVEALKGQQAGARGGRPPLHSVPRQIPATAAQAAPSTAPAPAPEETQETDDVDLYMMVLNMVVGRMIRGYKAGEDPEDVADVLAGMFPDLLDQVESIPEDQVVKMARDHADKVRGGRELLADPKAEVFLRAVYRALVAISKEPLDDAPSGAGQAGGAV